MKIRKFIIIICVVLCVATAFATAFLAVKYNNAFVEFNKFETYYGAKIPRGLIKNYFFIEGENTNSLYAEILLTQYGYEKFIKQFNEKSMNIPPITELNEDIEMFLKDSIVHRRTLEFIKNKDELNIFCKIKENDIYFCVDMGFFVIVKNKIGYTLVVSGKYNNTSGGSMI